MAFRPLHPIIPSRLLMPRARPLETILQGIHQFIETLEKFVPQWEIPAKTEWDFPEWEKNLPQTAGDVMGYFRSWWFFTSKMSRAWHPGVKTRGLFPPPTRMDVPLEDRAFWRAKQNKKAEEFWGWNWSWKTKSNICYMCCSFNFTTEQRVWNVPMLCFVYLNQSNPWYLVASQV